MSKASKASRSSEAWQIFKNYDCTSSNSFATPSSTASRLRQSKRDDGGCGVWTHASLDSGVLNSFVLKTTALDHSATAAEFRAYIGRQNYVIWSSFGCAKGISVLRYLPQPAPLFQHDYPTYYPRMEWRTSPACCDHQALCLSAIGAV